MLTSTPQKSDRSEIGSHSFCESLPSSVAMFVLFNGRTSTLLAKQENCAPHYLDPLYAEESAYEAVSGLLKGQYEVGKVKRVGFENKLLVWSLCVASNGHIFCALHEKHCDQFKPSKWFHDMIHYFEGFRLREELKELQNPKEINIALKEFLSITSSALPSNFATPPPKIRAKTTPPQKKDSWVFNKKVLLSLMIVFLLFFIGIFLIKVNTVKSESSSVVSEPLQSEKSSNFVSKLQENRPNQNTIPTKTPMIISKTGITSLNLTKNRKSKIQKAIPKFPSNLKQNLKFSNLQNSSLSNRILNKLPGTEKGFDQIRNRNLGLAKRKQDFIRDRSLSLLELEYKLNI